MDLTGLLVKKTDTISYVFFELMRMLVLLVLTYTYVLSSAFQTIFRQLYLISFWPIIIAARLSEIWIIKLINGIVEFDRKVTPLSTRLSIQQRSISKKRWDACFVLFVVYFIGIKLYQLYSWPPRVLDVDLLAITLFGPPFVIHFAVIISTCFILHNLYVRFGTLNDLWERLPAGLIAVPDQWSHTDIAATIDDTRLLHAELCGLLNTFSLGYGPLLVAFFVFNFISTLMGFFLLVIPIEHADIDLTDKISRISFSCLGIGQSIVFMMLTITLVSFINDKIKIFMNQISVYESDEITAFGLFKINLNLVMSILVLLITGIATLIQMKQQSFVLNWINEIKSVAALQFKLAVVPTIEPVVSTN